jgi:putative peptide zinc metalloprotease protein
MQADSINHSLGLGNAWSATSGNPSASTQEYKVIPLSVQQDGDLCVVGNADLGEFYQLPEVGVRILRMLESGETVERIRPHLWAADLDINGFVDQMADIGFIYPKSQWETAQRRLQASAQVLPRTFNVDPRIARALFSLPMLACYVTILLFAIFDAVHNPALRINLDALYAEQNRTLLLAVILGLSLVQTVMHELGHMLAAARRGIKSRYSIGNRLWTIVAESDLTGILTLPKSQRYLPMLAGLMVDTLSVSALTILLGIMLRHGAGPFAIQVVQILVLETIISMAWQFNVFVKTDIYFVLCNYFSYPDLDRDARIYLRHLLHRATLGRHGSKAPHTIFNKVLVLRIFSFIWLIGRAASLLILFFVFVPTMWRYLASAADLLSGPSMSFWAALDNITYVAIACLILAAGIYMWLKNRPT